MFDYCSEALEGLKDPENVNKIKYKQSFSNRIVKSSVILLLKLLKDKT